MSKDLIEEIATTSRGQQEAEVLTAGERELARLVALVGEDVAKAVNLRVEVVAPRHHGPYYCLFCDYNNRAFKVFPPVEGESGLWTLTAVSLLAIWVPAKFHTREEFAEALFYGQSTTSLG